MGDNGYALLTFDRTASASNPTPLVYCVVVNWNGCTDTLACLASLRKQDYRALRVVVVDNGSSDDSVARIRAEFPDVTVIETGKNLGFPCGSNVGMRHALQEGAEYVWQLNNDTFAPADSCSKLVARALQVPDAGIIGSVLYFMHDPSQVQAWGGGNLNLWTGRATHFLAPATLGPTSYLTFASALIPREVLLKVGLLFEGFFMYWDDPDLALRVTTAGYRLAVAEDTAILHKEGGSTERRSPVIDRYATASALHFLRRHSPVPWLSMAVLLTTKLASRLLRCEWQNTRAVLLAVGDYRIQRRQVYRETV